MVTSCIFVAESVPAQMLQADTWRRYRLESTRSEFAAAYPYPFLVRVPVLGRMGAPGALGPVSFHTVVQPQAALPERPSLSSFASLDSQPLELLVFPIRKVPGNPFPERISLGRAPNCDVSIRDGSISKLHGHFCDVSIASVHFVDAKSANGTRVDGQVLDPGKLVPIASGSFVTFGRVRLQLVGPEQLYDML
jgi:FHA domain